MIDWKRKLSSRKFWVAVVGFVSALLVALNYSDMTVEQVSAVITAGGVLVAYILGESYIDGKEAEGTVIEVEEFADIQGEE